MPLRQKWIVGDDRRLKSNDRRESEMIKIENVEVCGWEAAIRGMRNPHNSWSNSDSGYNVALGKMPQFFVGANDQELMRKLAKGGSVHAKYRRYIDVFVDITAPLYFWKEFKTYRKGRKFLDEEDFYSYDDEGILEDNIEMNSCSTMHKIHSKEFELDDFSHEQLNQHSLEWLQQWIEVLNVNREIFIRSDNKDKEAWWQIIQLLPSSYNQRRTVKLNYEVLGAMYHWRKDHKLDEWREFCKWIESLPYSELITGKER